MMRTTRQLNAVFARACADMVALDPPKRTVDPTRKRLDPSNVPPSCAQLAAMRGAEQHLADLQRPPDPLADLKREQMKPRCLVCNVPLVDGRGGHMYCEEHRGKNSNLFGRHAAPLAMFEMEAYSW